MGYTHGVNDMESLFYELISDSHIKRHIKILEIVEKNKMSVAFAQLQGWLQVSTTTLKKDLAKIQKIAPKTMQIRVSKEFVFVDTTYEGIQNFIFDLAQTTLSYKILSYSFHQPEIPLEELAERLFTSNSTLKNRIRYMNRILKRFHCRLSTYSTMMHGEEVNIRYFFRMYFSEFRDLFIAKKIEQLKDYYKVFDTMREIMLRQNFRMLNYSYFQITQWLLITQERIQANYRLALDASFVARIQEEPTYREFKNVYKTATREVLHQKDMEEEEVVWGYIASLDAISYTTEKENLYVCRDVAFPQMHGEAMLTSISEVANILHIPNYSTSSFVNTHQCFFKNLYFMSQLTPMFQMVSSTVKAHVEANLKDIYQVWFQVFTNSHTEAFSYLQYPSEVACTAAMITSQFLLRKAVVKRRVLFSYTGEAGLSSYLEAKTRFLFSADIDCIFAFKQPLSNDIIESMKPEIVVCNYNNIETIDFDKVVRISYIPNEHEWTRLSNYLLKHS